MNLSLIFTAVNVAFRVYVMLLIVRILLSWIPHNPYQPVIRFIYEVTEPYLAIFRRIIPPFGAVDLSPIVAFLVLDFIIRPLIFYLLRIVLLGIV
jgi:YggT family protein